MMYSSYREFTPDTLPMPHPHDFFLGDVSTQMAISQVTRRHSKGSAGGQQRTGQVMRVHKPCSANTSPRSSTSASRRRTMAIDCSVPHRQRQPVDAFPTTKRNGLVTPTEQTSRPVSWHPTSCLQQPPRQQFTSYPFPYSTLYTDHHDPYPARPHFSPMMTAYSNDTSPCSTFSPLPLFPGNGDTASYAQPTAWEASQRKMASYPPFAAQSTPEPLAIYDGLPRQPLPEENAHWNAFPAQRYTTSPPTPESFTQLSHSQPTVSEDGDSFDPLANPEDDGEILVGMGLYDAPEKHIEDPQLNNYRSTVSALLGSSLKFREPQGKGLKLEETWEPPKSDDEDEEQDDDDDVAEEA
ncbi:hypothetical protein HIM_00406 [Hirsutella minnesotensis 3608]|nr:hypothetical protein HIM_00406 [Hirsutella minnesotensis 3608]